MGLHYLATLTDEQYDQLQEFAKPVGQAIQGTGFQIEDCTLDAILVRQRFGQPTQPTRDELDSLSLARCRQLIDSLPPGYQAAEFSGTFHPTTTGALVVMSCLVRKTPND